MTRPANEPGTGAVLRALTRILERAAALRAGGCDPWLAINRAITAERASFALARVARAAWALALLPDDPGPMPASMTATLANKGEHALRVDGVAWELCS
jgi:hypothetical protein